LRDVCVTIYGKSGEGIIAFPDSGIETLINLLKEIRSQPGGLKEYRTTEIWQNRAFAAQNPASRRPLAAGYELPPKKG